MFQATGRWRLVVARGGQEVLRLPLAEGEYLLGRDGQSELRLLGMTGVLRVSAEGVELEDESGRHRLDGHPLERGAETVRAERTAAASGQTAALPESGPQPARGVVVEAPGLAPVTLRAGELRVGADPSCGLSLKSSFVSQHHCALFIRGGRLFVRDLGSRNGTFLNEVKVLEAEVEPPARLRVGDTVVRVTEAAQRGGAIPYIVGEQAALREAVTSVLRFAPTRTTVLIHGESGTGKELIARALHDASQRRHKPFVAVNCGAINEDALSRELFGDDHHPGAIAQADAGTCFLDEVGEIPFAFQALLLRVLETGEVKALGGRVRRYDVRFVAATHRDLQLAQRRGVLREDLYHRLSQVTITLPPLRERQDDIALLVRHFLQALAPPERTLRASDAALAKLRAHPWPGNVRELRNAVSRAVVEAVGSLLDAEDFVLDVVPDASERETSIVEAERDLIVQALREARGERMAAARALGIARSTLYRKLDAYGISEEELRGMKR